MRRRSILKSWKTTLLQAAAATGLVAYGATAQANPGSSENALMERLNALEAQLAQMLIVQDAAVAPPSMNPGGVPLTASWDNGLKLADAGGDNHIKVGGRLHWDNIFLQEDRDVRLGLGKQLDGVLARRARLAVSGQLNKHFIFKAEYDFAAQGAAGAAGVGITDLYIGLRDLPTVGPYIHTVKLGNQKVPFGLEANVSSNHTTFMERGLTDALDFGFDPGLTAAGGIESGKVMADWAVGIFKADAGFGTVANNGEWYLALRETNKFQVNDDMFIVAGVSLMYGSPSGDAVAYADPTELGLMSGAAGAGAAAKSEYRAGVEVAVGWRGFLFQSEMMYAKAERPSGITLNDPEPWAAYAQVSYMLTGEQRPWKHGRFGRVTPKADVFAGGWGAFEVAARYSHLDLSNQGLGGGRLNNGTLGVNWYMTANMKVMMNYLYEDITPAAGTGGRIHGLGIRMQVDF
jgi:phosphate-selective porin OprO/OprP